MKSLSLLFICGLITACGAPVPDKSAEAGNDAVPTSAPSAPAAALAGNMPTRFHGTFDRSAAECASPSDHRLVISARELRFHESVATVRRVEAEGSNRATVVADYQGEGESWSASDRLELSDDGDTLNIIGNGVETLRVRCSSDAGPRPPTWTGTASGEGDGLWLGEASERTLTLFCPAGRDELIVNVPAFHTVGSEDRMSFGSGGTVVALVADPSGDRNRGGVTGKGPVPRELERILAGPSSLAVNYGAQNSGPHPTPPPALVAAFLTGCRD